MFFVFCFLFWENSFLFPVVAIDFLLLLHLSTFTSEMRGYGVCFLGM